MGEEEEGEFEQGQKEKRWQEMGWAGNEVGAAGDGDREWEKKGKKIVNFAITAVLVFNRRGFVVRRGSVRAWTFRC